MSGKRIPAAVAAALALCLGLAGCSSSFTMFDVKNLMAPPTVNEDQQVIYQLLRDNRQEAAFVYPTTGEYRSAIILQDFTGDGEEDAVGFVSLEESGTEVRFLTRRGGRWELLAAFRNQANQVDRVCFGKLTSRTRDDVVIGWGSASGATGRTASVSAYLYDQGFGMRESPMGVYGEMALCDLDGNGLQEIFTVDKYVPAEAEGEEPTPAAARLYAWDGATIRETASTGADNNITSYSQALAGRLDASLSGVVLDGARADGSLTTQVFCLEDGSLVNYPAGVNTEEYASPFVRPSSAPFLSRDVDGDGILEIPRATLLPCLPEDTVLDSTSYLVEWTSFRPPEGAGQLTARVLMNQGENYWFRLPYRMRNSITALNNAETRTVTYCLVTRDEDGQEDRLGPPLFAIRTFPRAAWESRDESDGYDLLSFQGDTFYGIRVQTRDPEYVSFCESLKSGFQLLSE